MKKLLFLVFVIIGIAAFLCFQTNRILYSIKKIDKDVVIHIKRGATLSDIASILEENKLIENKIYFVIYARFKRIYPQIKAGEYLIDNDVSLMNLADILTSGKLYSRKITFPEGITASEIKEHLLKNNMLSGDVADFSEGEFLPETYTFSYGEKRNIILQQGIKAMHDFLQKTWDERDKDLPLKNKKEMLILASIVEKETGIEIERAMIASVFINRLKKNMPLQTDPTVIYALTEGKKDLMRNLTRKDLMIDSPYNTYKHNGLPPMPICSPGKAAILAVAHPDKTPYLYFVASGTGGHNFATTLYEHNNNVAKWRKFKSSY